MSKALVLGLLLGLAHGLPILPSDWLDSPHAPANINGPQSSHLRESITLSADDILKSTSPIQGPSVPSIDEPHVVLPDSVQPSFPIPMQPDGTYESPKRDLGARAYKVFQYTTEDGDGNPDNDPDDHSREMVTFPQDGGKSQISIQSHGEKHEVFVEKLDDDA